MRKKSIYIFYFILFLCSCAQITFQPPVTEMRFVMDTLVRISVYSAAVGQNEVYAVIEKAFGIMEEIETEVSAYHDSSEIVKASINAGSGSYRIKSGHALNVISSALRIAEETQGAFEPAIGPVKQLWGFHSSPAIPDPDLLADAVKLADWQSLSLEGRSITFLKPQMRLDLGGTAKGYAVDKAAEFLKNNGIHSAIVDAGGDLRIFGKHPFKPLWGIGVQHPRSSLHELAFEIHTEAVSIATSGDYERYFIKNGVRYHHLLDPETGMPARGCVSVTIAAETAMAADAYATAVFIMGFEKGKEFIEKRNDLEGIIMYEQDGRLHAWTSCGLKDKTKNLLMEVY